MAAQLQGAACTTEAVAAVDAYYAGGASALSSGQCLAERQAERERLTPDSLGTILLLVGLPARGKSFISRKVCRFLEWRGFATRVFNVGMYRRDATPPEQSGRSGFFDSSNVSAKIARDKAAHAALTDVLSFMDDGGNVAIFDATNSMASRRAALVDRIRHHHRRYSIIFIEVICDLPTLVEANMLNKVMNSPDFQGMPPDEALVDIKSRIARYEEVYETVRDEEGAYMKLFNLSSKVMANYCFGRMSRSLLPYLMSIHIGTRPIWLVRAGAGCSATRCPDSGSDRLSRLSVQGQHFAQELAIFVKARAEQYWENVGKPMEPTQVFTSTMPRAVGSVCYATVLREQTSALNPIDKGQIGRGWWDVECHADTPPWEEVGKRHPEFWGNFAKDPLRHRFPGGESYMDVVSRLETLLVEVEMCTRPVLIVSHITVLQLLLAYFNGTPVEDAWRLPFPKNAVVEMTPTLGGGFRCSEHILAPACASVAPAAVPAAPSAAPARGEAEKGPTTATSRSCKRTLAEASDGVQSCDKPGRSGGCTASAVDADIVNKAPKM